MILLRAAPSSMRMNFLCSCTRASVLHMAVFVHAMHAPAFLHELRSCSHKFNSSFFPCQGDTCQYQRQQCAENSASKCASCSGGIWFDMRFSCIHIDLMRRGFLIIRLPHCNHRIVAHHIREHVLLSVYMINERDSPRHLIPICSQHETKRESCAISAFAHEEAEFLKRRARSHSRVKASPT